MAHRNVAKIMVIVIGAFTVCAVVILERMGANRPTELPPIESAVRGRAQALADPVDLALADGFSVPGVVESFFTNGGRQELGTFVVHGTTLYDLADQGPPSYAIRRYECEATGPVAMTVTNAFGQTVLTLPR